MVERKIGFVSGMKKKVKKESVKKNSSRRAERLENMAGYMQLSPDILAGSALVHVYGKKYVRIENYRGIVDYDEKKLKLMTKEGVLQITGVHLEIAYCSDVELCVRGKIEKAEYI